MLLEWAPIEARTGMDPPTSPSKQYTLPSEFGEVTLECPQKIWSLNFGSKVGAITYKVPQGPPGNSVLDCKNFGAPLRYSGSCKFVCSEKNPSWDFVSWDECTCLPPWGANIEVKVDYMGSGLELRAECTRRCTGGKLEVLNSELKTVASWTLGEGQRWSLAINESTLKHVRKSGRTIVFKWVPVEVATGKKEELHISQDLLDLLGP